MLAIVLALVLVQEDSFQGTWKPIDLDLREVPAREAFEALFTKAGSRIALPETLEDRPVTLRVNGAPYWKAFDEICRAHGNLRFSERPFYNRGEMVEVGTWIDRPVFYRGPIRLHVYDLATVREFRYPRRRDRTDVTLILTWSPDFTPVADFMQIPGRLKITRAVDDTGKSLLPPVDGDDNYDYSANGGVGRTSSAQMFRLQPADAKATRLAILEGEWDGSYLGDLEEVRFEKPEESVGQTKTVGPIRVTLKAFGPSARSISRADEKHFDARLVLSVDPSATEEWKEQLKKVPLERRSLWQMGYVADGVSSSTYLRSLSKNPPESPELQCTLRSLQAAPASLSITVGKSIRAGSFAFSFKDLKLP